MSQTPQDNKEIHPEADKLIKRLITDFEDNLRLQANVLARNDELVLKNHVRQAVMVVRRRQEHGWFEELLIIFGGGLLGAFLDDFPGEMSQDVILGFIGMFFVFVGIFRRHA